MAFIGFLVWLALGFIAGAVVWGALSAAGTTRALTLVFGILGAFIGGMLGVSAYIHHDPQPLRVGGLIGAAAGAFLFTYLYHYIAREAV